jgi:transaldolase
LSFKDLKIKIFADGADLKEMKKAHLQWPVKGFTTNPTLLKKAGVTNYEAFAKTVLNEITDLPISFEVFSDDFSEMEKEARKIAAWGKNIHVKIPITNTKKQSSISLIEKLSADGIPLNVTAMTTLDQVRVVFEALNPEVSNIVSVFAGRIADTGRDPCTLMSEAVDILKSKPNLELLWASPREVLNLIQADQCGCHIITMTTDLLKKIHLIGKDLEEFSLETVKMFYNDAQSSGLKIL